MQGTKQLKFKLKQRKMANIQLIINFFHNSRQRMRQIKRNRAEKRSSS